MNSHFLNRRLAYVLGFAGLIPFALLAAACMVSGPALLDYVIHAQHAYGVAILSFLGGLHWGAAMIAPDLTAPQTRRALWWSVVPSLIAWSSAIAHDLRFLVLIMGFLVAYAVDKRLYPLYPMPAWMLTLRFWLTAIVVACLLITVFTVHARA